MVFSVGLVLVFSFFFVFFLVGNVSAQEDVDGGGNNTSPATKDERKLVKNGEGEEGRRE